MVTGQELPFPFHLLPPPAPRQNFLIALYAEQSCLCMQINHNQSLEVPFPTTPAFAGNQAASRRRLLASLYEDNISNDQSFGYIQQQQQYKFADHRSKLANASQGIDSAANAIDSVDHFLHHGIHSSAQNYSNNNVTGLWFGYNVSYMPHETLHEHYNLTHDDGNQTVTAGLWYGYNVQYRRQPSMSNSGNFTPRYIGGRNQLLGGLYLQEVGYASSACACAHSFSTWPVLFKLYLPVRLA